MLRILHLLLQTLLIQFLVFSRNQLFSVIKASHFLIDKIQQSIGFFLQVVNLIDAKNFLNSHICTFLGSVFQKLPELGHIALRNVHVNVPGVHFVLVFSVHVS